MATLKESLSSFANAVGTDIRDIKAVADSKLAADDFGTKFDEKAEALKGELITAATGAVTMAVTPLQEAIDQKQVKLTAGSGVNITDGGVISVTVDAPEDVDLSGYYTKTEADEKFATKAGLADYVTTAQLDGYATTTALDAKQNKLAAGEGIKIEEDTVSVTLDTSSFATKEELASYALSSVLSGYVTTEVAAQTYATKEELVNYVTTAALSSYVQTTTLEQYVTTETATATYAAKTALDTKQDKLTAGTGVEITPENQINVTLDTTKFATKEDLGELADLDLVATYKAAKQQV